MITTVHYLEVARVKIDLAERLLREAQQHLRDGCQKDMLPRAAAHEYDRLIDQHSRGLVGLLKHI